MLIIRSLLDIGIEAGVVSAVGDCKIESKDDDDDDDDDDDKDDDEAEEVEESKGDAMSPGGVTGVKTKGEGWGENFPGEENADRGEAG